MEQWKWFTQQHHPQTAKNNVEEKQNASCCCQFRSEKFTVMYVRPEIRCQIRQHQLPETPWNWRKVGGEKRLFQTLRGHYSGNP